MFVAQRSIVDVRNAQSFICTAVLQLNGVSRVGRGAGRAASCCCLNFCVAWRYEMVESRGNGMNCCACAGQPSSYSNRGCNYCFGNGPLLLYGQKQETV